MGIGAKDWHIIRELYNEIPFDWVMLANSLTIYRHPQELLELISRLHQDGVGIINSAIFNAGFLTGGAYFDYRLIDPALEEDQGRMDWRAGFFKTCKEFDVEPGDACLCYSLAPSEVQAVALNPSKPERILRNKQILNKKLPSEFWLKLKSDGIINNIFPSLLK